MAAEIVFYTNPLSRGGIVHWMLEELGVPYRTELLEYGTTMKAPGYLAINPMGKVPAIKHGEVVVTEAAAICAYLADAFPEAGLAPPLAERGPYYRWLFFGAGPVEAAVGNHSCGFQPTKEQEGRLGYGSLRAVIDTLAQAVAGQRYIAGDRFSAADVYIGSQIGWGMRFGSVEKRPEFETYWAGLRDRPAQRRVEAHFEEVLAKRRANAVG
jgi:glutathione S-transferase